MFEAPGGAVIERTVPAVVGVPTPVNVNGFLLPDLTVQILPLPPNLITVSFLRLPTGPARMPLLAEVIVDVPGGIGASFGLNSTASASARAGDGSFRHAATALAVCGGRPARRAVEDRPASKSCRRAEGCPALLA